MMSCADAWALRPGQEPLSSPPKWSATYHGHPPMSMEAAEDEVPLRLWNGEPWRAKGFRPHDPPPGRLKA